MRAEGTACRDAGSAPTRQADDIRRITRVATIFPPGAWVARVSALQRNDEHEVNVTLSRNHMFTIYA
ncbi:transcriptional regulator [Citrobacter freundii]|nr:transcriptional regulator [Citrobacter freundii]